MFKQLTQGQQKGLAIGLLLIVVLLIIQILIAPLVSSSHLYKEEISDLQFKLSKYQQAVDNKAELENQLNALKAELASGKLFQSNIAPGVVAASLQNQIRQIVEKAGGQLISTQVLTEKKEDSFTRVSVNVRLTGNDQVLQRLLFHIESAKPLLLINKIALSSNRRRHKAGAKLNRLNMSLEIATYLSLKAS